MISDSPKFTQRCTFLALFFLTVCFFVSPISVSLTTVTYLLAALLVLLSGDWRARWERLKVNKAGLSFWLLGAVFIIGVFYTTATKSLVVHDLQKRHWLFITPLFIAMLTDDRWRQRMINAFLGAMVITLILSPLKFFFHINLVSWAHIKIHQDAGDVFTDHIVQSLAMNIAAFICAYRFLFEKKFRMVYAILFILMGINILFISHGRTGYGTFFLLLCYLGLIRFGWKGMFSAGIISVLMISVVFFISPGFQSRVKAIYNHAENYNQMHHATSVGIRIEMLSIAKKMISERPWFGYGTGGIETALPSVVPAKDRVFNPSVDFVESVYLNFLLEFGLFGFVVLLIALALQIKATFQLPHNYRCLMQAMLICIFFGGIFNAFFVSFSPAHFYSIFAALCFSAQSNPLSRYPGRGLG